MEGWDSFFLGQLGASAALGGLLFVAISIVLVVASLFALFTIGLNLGIEFTGSYNFV